MVTEGAEGEDFSYSISSYSTGSVFVADRTGETYILQGNLPRTEKIKTSLVPHFLVRCFEDALHLAEFLNSSACEP
jgi:hypothetical protein